MLPVESTITLDEEIEQLKAQGFSEEQVAAMLSYREQYTTGLYKDESPEYRRLDFIRWLYTTGKIED